MPFPQRQGSGLKRQGLDDLQNGAHREVFQAQAFAERVAVTSFLVAGYARS